MSSRKKSKKNDGPKDLGSKKVKDLKLPENEPVITENSSENIGEKNEGPVITEPNDKTDIGTENNEQPINTDEGIQSKKEISSEVQVDSLNAYIRDFDKCIIALRIYRKKIDYILNIIDLSGLQKEITTKIKAYNPVEHSIVSLVKAKGSLGEFLKKMVPSPDVIAFKAYQNYLGLCGRFEEDPTYPGLFVDLPEEYITNLTNEVTNALKNDLTAEENHQNWMDDKIKDGWKFGKIKDSKKKTHPSLIPFNELSESKKTKNSEFLRIVNEYKNPYLYPKQSGKDVEEVTDKYEVKDLNIAIEEDRYFNKGVSINTISELNRVQLVDFIKSLIADLISDYVKFNSMKSVNYFIKNLVSVHMNDKIASHLLVITKSSVYTDLIDAKNLFGYTYQYVK